MAGAALRATLRPMTERSFQPISLAVLTISDTRTQETDTSGAWIADALVHAGHRVVSRRIVADDFELIRGALAELIGDETIDVVITTGGTGVTRRDVTPEVLASLATKWISGFGELFRTLSYAEIGASTIQSRAEAALCDTTLVFTLPGSTGAVRLALERIILPQIDNRTRPCNFVELLPRIKAEQAK
jgi:molybdenum cofactor biosynthesis protein B